MTYAEASAAAADMNGGAVAAVTHDTIDKDLDRTFPQVLRHVAAVTCGGGDM